MKEKDMKEKSKDILKTRWLYEQLNEFCIRKTDDIRGMGKKVKDKHDAVKETMPWNTFGNSKWFYNVSVNHPILSFSS